MMISVLLTSCGQQDRDEPDVDSRLAPAYEKFLNSMATAGIEVNTKKISSIELISEEDWSQEGTVGLCYLERDVKIRYTKIKVEKKQGKIQIRNVGIQEQIEVTLIHELGHCLFNMQHSDDPDNIMYPMADYSIFPAEAQALSGLLKNLGH
jgi:predicted Zn-dependent protease